MLFVSNTIFQFLLHLHRQSFFPEQRLFSPSQVFPGHLALKTLNLNNSAFSAKILTLAHMCTVGHLFLHLRYFHRLCSNERNSIILLLVAADSETRCSNHINKFTVHLQKPRTIQFIRSILNNNPLLAFSTLEALRFAVVLYLEREIL